MYPEVKVALEVVKIYWKKKKKAVSLERITGFFSGAVNDYKLVLYVFAIYGLWSMHTRCPQCFLITKPSRRIFPPDSVYSLMQFASVCFHKIFIF